jgi:hypothetical protein
MRDGSDKLATTCCDTLSVCVTHSIGNRNITYDLEVTHSSVTTSAATVSDPSGTSSFSNNSILDEGAATTNNDHHSLFFDPGGNSFNSNTDGSPSSPDRNCNATVVTAHGIDSIPSFDLAQATHRVSFAALPPCRHRPTTFQLFLRPTQDTPTQRHRKQPFQALPPQQTPQNDWI